MVKPLTAEQARKMSETNTAKLLPILVQEFVDQNIRDAVDEGLLRVSFDNFDQETCLRIASWLGHYGYRAYYDQDDHLVVLWD